MRMQHLWLSAGIALACLACGGAFAQGKAPDRRAHVPPKAVPSASVSIVAVVNGDVISDADVDLRRKLFAISTGQGITPETLDRLTPQIVRQLIDERLRLQEVQRRHIVVTDKQIADAIHEIEQRNNMPAGGLRAKLASVSVDLRTLIDQIRVQIGWNQVLRQVIGAQGQVSDADIKQREAVLKSELGKPEFDVSEIFVPITEPSQAEDANRFAETVIQQLHNGAPFAVMATQFSQSQDALQGGSLGWVQADQLDPEVLRVVQEMPVGAVSNPIRVPGEISIVTVRAKREVGQDPPLSPTSSRCSFLSPASSTKTTPPISNARRSSRRNASPPAPPTAPRWTPLRRPRAAPPASPATCASIQCRPAAARPAHLAGRRQDEPAHRHQRRGDGADGLLARPEKSRHPRRQATGRSNSQRARGAGLAPVDARPAASRRHQPAVLNSPLGDLPPLREVIARHGLAARRGLGQHFLLDANICARIVRQAGDLTGRHVIEVGPGPGGLHPRTARLRRRRGDGGRNRRPRRRRDARVAGIRPRAASRYCG